MTETRRASARLREPAAKAKEAEEAASIPAPKQAGRGRPKGGNRNQSSRQTVVSESFKQKSPEKIETITLPSKVVEGQALPSLPTRQAKNLSESEWQSISESGVLAASIPRSRNRWLHEGMFETYWSKSTYKKKKDATDAAKAKENRPNMTKIGTCQMLAEPHIFDVTLFVIKDVSAAPVHQQNNQQFVSYNTTPGHYQAYNAPVYQPYQAQKVNSPAMAHKPVYGPPFPASHSIRPPQMNTQPAFSPSTTLNSSPNTSISKPTTAQPQPSAHVSNVQAPSIRDQSNTEPPSQPSPSKQSHDPAPTIQPSASALKPPITETTLGTQTKTSTLTSKTKPPSASSTSISSKSQPAKAPPAQDPVIQMLASRAQKDDALKQVMRLVAEGQANQQQLKYFQGHIDELTKIVANRQEEERKKKAALEQQQKPPPIFKHQYPPSPATIRTPNQPQKAAMQPMPVYNSPLSRLNPPVNQSIPRPNYPPPAHIQPKAPRPVHIPPPLHVLLEFSQNSTDRFLFPKNSIVEYDAKRTSMLASFLVVKTEAQLQNFESDATKKSKKSESTGKTKVDTSGTTTTQDATVPAEVKAGQSQADSQKDISKFPEKQYYQPVTVRFECSDPSVLSVFGRVVAPVDQVQKYMLDVASKADFMTPMYLTLQLPRESKEVVITKTNDTKETTR